MKIIFGTDITENRKNTMQDGEEFIAKKISDELKNQIDEKAGVLIQLSKKAELPLLLRAVRAICGYSAAIVIGMWITLLPDGENIMKEVPWLICATAAALAVWAVLFVISRVRMNDVVSSVECETAVKDVSGIRQECLDYFGVKDEERIDVMRLKYKRKPDGTFKIVQTNLGMHFENVLSDAFCRNDCLCFTDYNACYEIPLDELTGIRKINRWAGMTDWNRNEKWDSGEYEQYNIKKTFQGGYMISCYYALCVSHGGEDYELYFAPYDLDAVKKLTGITVITE